MTTKKETVMNIALEKLVPFRDHPFQVRDDEQMQMITESIRSVGVLVPAIARPLEDGSFELISGHRRKHACEVAGLSTLPVIVRDVDPDTATVMMVDSNFQREEILPSERAKAYKMKLEAIKRQGARSDLTSDQVGQKSERKTSRDLIFSMIESLSSTVIVPIAGLIITFVLCYELITMITERNNMHDMDTWMFFKWFFKSFVAVFLVTHTFDIVMAIFDVGQHLVAAAAGVIGANTSIDIASTIADFDTAMESMELGELLQLALETMLISMGMKIISILITVVLYGRMIEIYLYTSVAPVPFATMANREWGQIGNNYARGLLALGFQGFFIMVIVGIYCVLVNSMTIANDIHSALFSIAAYGRYDASPCADGRASIQLCFQR